MITRGYLLGEILDSLTSISEQVETRCVLGLTDLNRYLEDFFKDILNLTLGESLVNCNKSRSNAPGIDLFNENTGTAFQITSQKTSSKITETLTKAKKLKVVPTNIYVLIIGKKQSSYSIDKALFTEANFTEANIWDIHDLCKRLMDLKVDTLQLVYEYTRKELARVNIDLEIPDTEGNYPTNVSSYIEAIPKPTITDFSLFRDYQTEQCDSYEFDLEEVQEQFESFYSNLALLPRITRDFFVFLLERCDEDNKHQSNPRINYNRLKRICSFPAFDEEITLLSEYGFADFCEPDDHGESPYVRMFAPKTSEYFLFELIDFASSKNVSLAKPVVNLDFSAFGI